MIKLNFILPFLLACFTSFAQTDFTKVYYPIINDAELAIVDDDHHTALNFYKEAFKLVEKPFAKDYYNAAICGVYTNRLSLTFDYLGHLVEKGYVVDSLRKDKFFKTFADTCQQWKDFEQQARLIKPTIDFSLRDSLVKAFEKKVDNFYVYTNRKSKATSDKNSTNINGADTLILLGDKGVSKNIIPNDFFTEYVGYYGFPDENTLGIYSYQKFYAAFRKGKAETLKNRFAPISFKDLDNGLLNQWLMITDFPDDIWYKGIREGKISPYTLKNRLTLVIKANYNAIAKDDIIVFKIKLDNDQICNKLQESLEKWYLKKERPLGMTDAEVNEKRLALGLSKLEDNYRKIIFKANNPTTPFIINSGAYRQEISYLANCEAAEKLINQSEELK